MKLREVDRNALRSLVCDGALARSPLHLVADVGATNTRLGFVGTLTVDSEIVFYKVHVTSVKALNAALEELRDELGELVCQRIVAAAMNIPGPTSGLEGGPIANYEGTNEQKIVRIRDFPPQLFPHGATMLLNDLAAGAYGVVAASRLKLFGDLFSVMWSPQGQLRHTEQQQQQRQEEEEDKLRVDSLGKGHVLVVAPGTGLGTACVQYHPFSDSFTVFPLEFGHTSVQSRQHKELLKAYEAHVKRGNHAVEYDDLCSGRGLEFVYNFLGDKKGSNHTGVSAAVIAKKAEAGDSLACHAMSIFYEFLMRICSQLAMGFLPRYVLIIGDNTVHNAFFLNVPENVQRLREQFLNHSMERYGFMSKATMIRQAKTTNLNLLGCAYVTQLEVEQRGEGQQSLQSKL